MKRSTGGDRLEAVRQLDETWTALHDLVQTAASSPVVLPSDERRYPGLLKEARILYGRLANVLGRASIEQAGHRFDAFQHVLGQPSISVIVRGLPGDLELWEQLWALAASAIAQTIGRLEAEPAAVRYMPAGSQLEAYVQLKDTLEEAAGSLVLVDPYVDDSTLQALLGVSPTVNIRLLTVKPSKDFTHALERFREQWKGTIEARVGPKDLHDRFLLLDERVFLSGASLKDLGQRASVLLELHNEAAKAAIRRDVDKSWNGAQGI